MRSMKIIFPHLPTQLSLRFPAASYSFFYLPACHQNHLHIAVSGCNLSSTPWPYIMTPSHIHTTSLRIRLLSPCGGTHRGWWRARSRGLLTEGTTCSAVSQTWATTTLNASAPQTLSTRRAGELARSGNTHGVAEQAIVPRSTTVGAPIWWRQAHCATKGGSGRIGRSADWERNPRQQQSILNWENRTSANLAAVGTLSTGWTYKCKLTMF